MTISGALRELIELSLHSNQLNGPIPRQFGQLTRLEVGCQLVVPSMSQRKISQVLQLHRNKLSGPLPKTLKELVYLIEFRASSNRFGVMCNAAMLIAIDSLIYTG